MIRTLLPTALLAVLCAACNGAGDRNQETASMPDEEDRPAAADVEIISRELLFGNPERTTGRLSHDARHVSWLAPVDGVLNVWVAPVDDPGAAKPVTRDDYRGIRNYFWSYTNEHIIYLQDQGGDENWRVYSVDLASGETTDLTPMEGIAAQINAVSRKHPQSILVGINDRDPSLHDVYRIDIETAERELVEQNEQGFAGYLADDDYRLRLAMQMLPDGGLAIMRPGDEGWETWMEVPQEDTQATAPIGFTADGETLYMVDSRGRNTAALVAIDVATDESEVLYEHPRADVGDTIAHPVTHEVQAAAANYLQTEWEVLDDAIAPDLEYLATVSEGEIEVLGRSTDDRHWIVGYTRADAPFRYYRYDREARQAEFLFTTQPGLEEAPLVPMHPLVIESRDGLSLVSYLTLPVSADREGSGRPEQPLPMVLLVHGGPWARDVWGYDANHQWLANRGYAVLSVNFRGSTGLGNEFVNAGDQEWAGKMHDDLIDAVNWAVEENITTEDQVAIMGGSYGGYATLVGLTFTPEVFACGVDIVGPSNLNTLLESIPPYWEPLFELFATRVGDPRTEEGRELLRERSPLTYADRIVDPLLIAQGANDPRVKQAESDQIVNAMKENGIPVTYVLFPDEGHGFARPENRLAFNAVAEAFLSECLGGRVEPIGDDFENSSIRIPEGADNVQGLSSAVAETPEPQ